MWRVYLRGILAVYPEQILDAEWLFWDEDLFLKFFRVYRDGTLPEVF